MLICISERIAEMLWPLAIKPIEKEIAKITGNRNTKRGPLEKKAGSLTTFLISLISRAWKTDTERTSF
jgi:hypothetical protein